MKRFVCFILICCTISLPISALSLFESDYDKDRWSIEQVTFDIPEDIPEDWLPLRASSGYLPIEVSWDNDKREIIVYSHDLPWKSKSLCTRRYKADNLPPEMIIKDGVTYCSPRLLSSFLEQRGFLYNNEVYYFNGEMRKSKLIKSGNSELFRDKVLTSIYELKLKSPSDYAFIRKYLTGGIVYSTKTNVPNAVSGSFAYIYPTVKNPTCYIVGDTKYGGRLANFIAHEAFHVWQYKNGGMNRIDEVEAWEYGIKVEKLLD